MDFRQAILHQMERRDLTRYRVMKLLDGRVPQTTLYQFLRGEHPISSDALGEIMGAVGLTLTANPDAGNVTPLSRRKTPARALKGRVVQ